MTYDVARLSVGNIVSPWPCAGDHSVEVAPECWCGGRIVREFLDGAFLVENPQGHVAAYRPEELLLGPIPGNAV